MRARVRPTRRDDRIGEKEKSGREAEDGARLPSGSVQTAVAAAVRRRRRRVRDGQKERARRCRWTSGVHVRASECAEARGGMAA
eukprot:COSAG02_NODE_7405_length_3031_cov_40.211460_2_plen_84_part_00